MPSVPLTSIAGSGVRAWVSGATYAVGEQAISLSNYQVYARVIAGAGTTDPSADGTNWRQISLSRKQVIRGSITIIAPATTSTATISSVVTSKSDLFFLGASNSNASPGGARVALTNSTTITATSGSSTGTTTVEYQVVEYY